MVQADSQNNVYNVQATSANNVIRVNSNTKNSNNAVDSSNNQAEYWAGVAEQYANAAEETVNNAISDIQAQEQESETNIQNYTNSSLNSLQDKYDELRDGLKTTYIHEQATASNVWQIEHNLNKKPSIMVVDTADTVIEGVEKYIDENNIEIYFNAAVKGKAYLN